MNWKKLPATHFLGLYLIFMAAGGVLYFVFSKPEAHLWINQFHNVFFDQFFYFLTYAGDGLFGLGVFLLLFLFWSIGDGLLLLISFLLSGGITQLLKRLVFHEELRPSKFFEGMAEIRTIPGLELSEFHSFPSGHSTSAFAIFFMLACLFPQRKYQFFFFAVAFLAAFSRVYLSQHFFIDIYTGSFIGTVSSAIVYIWLHDRFSKSLGKPAMSKK